MLKAAILGAGNVAVHGHVPGWLERKDVAIVAAAGDPEARRSDALGKRIAGVDDSSLDRRLGISAIVIHLGPRVARIPGRASSQSPDSTATGFSPE